MAFGGGGEVLGMDEYTLEARAGWAEGTECIGRTRTGSMFRFAWRVVWFGNLNWIGSLL